MECDSSSLVNMPFLRGSVLSVCLRKWIFERKKIGRGFYLLDADDADKCGLIHAICFLIRAYLRHPRLMILLCFPEYNNLFNICVKIGFLTIPETRLCSITYKNEAYMLWNQNIYVLKSKYRCFVRANSCILVRRQLELVAVLIEITLRVNEKRCRIVWNNSFLAQKRAIFSLKQRSSAYAESAKGRLSHQSVNQ